ncbi:MAG: sulfotransferase [Gammaproteobacteria bacterium]|nr:sulfotransferase [Gammaproteobacteria bacterium]
MNSIMQWLKSGFAAQQQGDLATAENFYKRVLKKDSGNYHGLNLMGLVAVNTGRSELALHYLSKALKQRDDDFQTHANIALAYKDLGEIDKAKRHFDRSLRLNSENPTALNNFANLLSETGEPGKAIPLFDRALKLAPTYAEAWCNLASSLVKTQQFDDAKIAAKRALTINNKLAPAHCHLGEVYKHLSDYPAARESLITAVSLDETYIEARVNLVNLLREMERVDEARQQLHRALALAPSDPSVLTSSGVLAEQLGDIDAAVSDFQRAIELHPNYVMAHYQLAQIKSRKSTQIELDAMLNLWKNQKILETERVFLAFGLFKALEQFERFDEAFDYLAAGNDINARHNRYDDLQAQRYLGAILESARQMSLSNNDESSGEKLIFVLGMPRSGTTLTEQILTSHSGVDGIGEVSYAYDLAREAERLLNANYPSTIETLTQSQLKHLADFYLDRVDSYDGKTWIVDKTPLNFQYIALLARIFPRARFVRCVREPVDNCFSIFKLPFGDSQSYAHSLASLGQYYRRYDRLMSGLSEQLPGRIFDSQYESLVDDVESGTKALCEFLGIDFEPSMLEFYQSKRLVRTPSASQVRQPIYRTSVAAWKRYERQLQPLVSALGE